jgi:hypothetical protein
MCWRVCPRRCRRSPESLPSSQTVAVWLRSPILPSEQVIPVVRLAAWLIWGWTCLTVAVRIAVYVLDALTRGAGWVRSLQEISGWVTVPLCGGRWMRRWLVS